MIERQMAADEKNLDNQGKMLGQKMSLLQQQHAIHKDTQVAKLATKNLYYEGLKEQIAGEAQQYDSPMYTERAMAANAQLDREQGMLKKQLGDALRAQAAAGAAAQYAQAKEVRTLRNAVYDKVLEQAVHAGQPFDRAVALAENEANRQIAAVYSPSDVPRRPTPDAGGTGSDPIANVPKAQQTEAIKELHDHATAEKGIAALEAAFKKYEALPATAGPWDRDRAALRANMMGAYKQALGPGMSSDNDAETFMSPLMPQYGSASKTNANNLELIKSTIRGKVATPILDTHSPEWKPKPLSLKPVGR